MIALDTNVLVDLLVQSQSGHESARRWLLSAREPLGTTHTNVGEVLRLLTHPRVFPAPLGLNETIALLRQFVENFQVKVLEESETWWHELAELLAYHRGLRGNEVFDARIALCLRYNGVKEIATYDATFAKYPFLTIVPI